MIELIFVIVILGILASVAIPRLAATREDAEISAAVANLRTLVSDATAYYTAKGEFTTGTGTTGTKWNEITNVPLNGATSNVTTAAKLKAGGKDCITVQLQNKTTGNATTAKPAHIVITKENGATGVCKQVQDSEPLKAYFASTIKNDTTAGKIAIGSSTSVYSK